MISSANSTHPMKIVASDANWTNAGRVAKETFCMGVSEMRDGRRVPVQAHLKSSDLSIGELARLTHVRASAIRYYEQRGLMPAPERRSGQRRYATDAVSRLKAIVAARRLGYSIRELEDLARLGVQGWRTSAKVKAHEFRTLISSLGAQAAELDQLANCDCDAGRICRL
ncbi:MerR family transcriptional regulator [bacterium]|nr:MerR family transcriptional regulator [bacterium]